MSATLLRVDGSHQLGTGHVVRCLALAQSLEKHGCQPFFVVRDYDPIITDLIQKKGFPVETIDRRQNFRDDALSTLKLAEKYNAKFIVADLSHEKNLTNRLEYTAFYESIHQAHKFMIVIDDINKLDFPFDIHVIPYYGLENHPYKFCENTRYLLGCSYFIVSPLLALAAGKIKKIRQKGKNILVAIGGSDPAKLTVTVARAMATMSGPHLSLKFVIGACVAPEVPAEIAAALQGFRGNIELCVNANIADLLLWSDIVISGGGLTKYEAALTGTPNLIISQYVLEAGRADDFTHGGSARHLGLIDQLSLTNIAGAVHDLLKDYPARSRMSQKGKMMVDGKGTQRIIDHIPRELLI